MLKNCVRCSKFLTTEKHKATHDFLDDGKNILFEEKPLDISKLPGLIIYSIEFQKHSDFYNFYRSEKCVDDFLKNIQYKFESNQKNWFKCSFYIENKQNSFMNNWELLVNTQYWSTETYDGKYFDDFILFGLKQDIIKRVIVNNISGSAWYFKRFLYLAVRFYIHKLK